MSVRAADQGLANCLSWQITAGGLSLKDSNLHAVECRRRSSVQPPKYNLRKGASYDAYENSLRGAAGGRDGERRASGTRGHKHKGGDCRFVGNVAISSTGRLQEREMRLLWDISLFTLHCET